MALEVIIREFLVIDGFEIQLRHGLDCVSKIFNGIEILQKPQK
jgi:hypothetical protein